jgi:hypothetical protein
LIPAIFSQLDLDIARVFTLKTGTPYTVKKVIDFPVSAGRSLTKLFLDGNNLIIPVQGEIG